MSNNINPSRGESEDDLSGYLNIYLDETDEQLDELVETMLVLEKDPQDESSLNAAFRLLHSMKGASGLMGFDQITVLTHHLETRFERLRSGRIQLDRTTVNLTLRCIDFLRQCNGRLRDGIDLSTPDELLEELHELEARAEEEVKAEIAEAGVAQPKAFAGSSSQATDSAPTDYTLPDLGTDYHIVIQFAADLQLKDLKAQSIATRLRSLGEIKATRPDLDDLESVLDLSQFDVILNTVHPHDQIIDFAVVEGVDRVEIRIPKDPDSPPIASWEPKSKPKPAVATASVPAPQIPPPSDKSEVSEDDQRRTDMPTKASGAKVVDTMRVDTERLDNLMNLAGELVVNRAQFIQVSEEIGPGLRKSGGAARSREFCDALTRTIGKLKREHAINAAGDWAPHIRELESGLHLMQEHTRVWEETRRCFGRLDEAIDQLSRVSDGLQRGVLGTRMVPVGPLFNRFKRVIRDLSQERDKQVELVIDGEATELDKRMIDVLGDPLVHLVRNSIDHGLETTDQRIAAGKPPISNIYLSARHRGNHVFITVRDNGRGIDVNKIRASLVKKNIKSREQAEAMSTADVIASIFHPGFSTADTVTDISGRGVGMDIVQSRIQEISGTIDITTVEGQGTTFTLKMPLTLAIVGSLLVRIHGSVFAIPKDDVREIVSIANSAIIDIRGMQTFEVRGEYMPLVCINKLFDWHHPKKSTATPSENSEIVILQSGGYPMGLRVDHSIGSQDVVIKSLEENFIGIDGLAGASILGNGEVALMLDVSALSKIAETNSRVPTEQPTLR